MTPYIIMMHAGYYWRHGKLGLRCLHYRPLVGTFAMYLIFKMLLSDMSNGYNGSYIKL